VGDIGIDRIIFLKGIDVQEKQIVKMRTGWN
jgi:hypothetical protein